ncbi:MAG: hypothetical protein KGH99_02830 [Thaumarchaeota archaeon]|nr:hypothetical protein [Nitrososphaerota archaeon]MDE1872395.1 hypothetical protein [Nitrososphaerota archaeon]
MNSRFRCTECGRTTEKFTATLEGPEGIFDGMIQYCHFCDLGFYKLSTDHIELVEIEKPEEFINTALFQSKGIFTLMP